MRNPSSTTGTKADGTPIPIQTGSQNRRISPSSGTKTRGVVPFSSRNSRNSFRRNGEEGNSFATDQVIEERIGELSTAYA
jgi:hypothetical protein